MSAPTTESYELKQIEIQVAGALTAFIHEMGGYVAWLDSSMEERAGTAHHRRYVSGVQNRNRRRPLRSSPRDRNTSKANWSHHDGRHNEFIAFANPRYGEGGDLWEGEVEKGQGV